MLQEDDVDLVAPFLQLPSASEYPDYYESIDNPVDMSMIKTKIDRGQVTRMGRQNDCCTYDRLV